MKKTYHLIEVRRGLEPVTRGPFLEENERDDAARTIHRAQSDEDSLFWADTDSDYDVFIIVDKRDRELVDAIFDMAYDIYMESDLTFDISPVIMSETFFNERLSQERRIARDIMEQGIPL